MEIDLFLLNVVASLLVLTRFGVNTDAGERRSAIAGTTSDPSPIAAQTRGQSPWREVGRLLGASNIFGVRWNIHTNKLNKPVALYRPAL